MADTGNNKATKFDGDKADWSVIKWSTLTSVIKVIEGGNDKYGKDNWTEGDGLERSRVFSAGMRHLIAWKEGENNDKCSDQPHLAHAIACLMMLIYYEDEKYGNDDR